MQFFNLGSSKTDDFETCFYDLVITKKDHPRYVKQVLGRIYVVFSPFSGTRSRDAGGGGVPKGLVHNTLMQFVTLGKC